MQDTINQRLNFIIESLNLSIRAFSAALGVSDTNTRNYLTKGTRPNSDYLEKVLRHFRAVNPAWLLLGEGEAFLSDSQNVNANLTRSKKDADAIQPPSVAPHRVTLEDCRRQLESSQREVEQLKALLEAKEALLAAKEETLSLLRARHTQLS